MATRGTFGLTHNGVTKMVYNHRDSYPEGLGQTFVDRIKQRTPEELLKARKNIKLGRCDNYGIEKFMNGWKKPQTRDYVTQEDIDDGLYIEYYYNYNIDDGTMDMDGDDYRAMRDLENTIKDMPHLITKS